VALSSERQSVRHTVRTECIVTTGNGRLVGDSTVDLSYHGVFVRGGTIDGPRLGEGVRVQIRIPSTQTWIDAQARVVRLSRGLRGEGDPSGLGLELVRMDPMSRVLLSSVIRSYPAAGPRRGSAQRDYASQVKRIQDNG